jgi:hypothetical protein
MKFDQQKVFPYPVLRPDIDDYLDGEFQAMVDFNVSDDASEVRINMEFALSVAEIQAEIDAGNAEFVAVIASRETFYRTTLRTAKAKTTKTFRADQIRGELLISPFIVAKKDIRGFRSVDINPEFGASRFDFDVGEVLAIDEPKAIYFDRDLFRPLSSVLVLARDPRQQEWTWKLSYDQDKLRILVGDKTKEEIDRARNTQKNKSILINSIWFSAVAEAVNQLKQGSDYDDLRWASVIRQQCHNKGIDLDGSDSDSYQIAQTLLANPLGLLEEVFREEQS